MEISIELTLTPLQDDFEGPIIEYIKAFRASGCTLNETPLSTQIYGEFSLVMNHITEATRKAFEKTDHIILQMKIAKSNRSNYEPNF
jgi:uncharacterized protein YqgV (UPF0045/DUF77 family)